MDQDDPLACWHLFTFTALLNESRYLAHTVKKLTTILDASLGPEQSGTTMSQQSKAIEDSELKTLKRSLEHLESDVYRALEVVKSTIDMVILLARPPSLTSRLTIILPTATQSMHRIPTTIWNSWLS